MSLLWHCFVGTDFWGLLNPDWNLCNRGKRQSPINIDPGNLLFDPDLGPIKVDDAKVTGVLENNGHSIIFRTLTSEELLLQGFSSSSSSSLSSSLTHSSSPSLLLVDHEGHHVSPSSSSSSIFNLHSHHHHEGSILSNSTSSSPVVSSLVSVPGNELSPNPSSQSSSSLMMMSPEAASVVSITGGPFSYNYHFDSIYLHFGRTDLHGSEHVVAGVAFPAEVSLFLLYSSLWLYFSFSFILLHLHTHWDNTFAYE